MWLLVRSDDGELVWATGGESGCIRRLSPEAIVTDIHCVDAGETIVGLALAGDNVFWLVDSAAQDRLESLSLTATTLDSPTDLTPSAGAQLRTLDDGGPNQLAARVIDGAIHVVWSFAPSSTEPVEEIVLQGGSVIARGTYVVFENTGTAAGGLVVNPFQPFWAVDGDYQRVFIGLGRQSDPPFDDLSDGATNPEFCDGRGYAAAAGPGDRVFIAGRNDVDGGGILSADGAATADDHLLVHELVHQVDPDEPRRHARGIGSDGVDVFYTTGGLGGSSLPGLFRVSAAGGIPERIVDTHGEGGAVVVDNDEVVWAEPDAGRIIRIAR